MYILCLYANIRGGEAYRALLKMYILCLPLCIDQRFPQRSVLPLRPHFTPSSAGSMIPCDCCF